jgi:hypothetical protein
MNSRHSTGAMPDDANAIRADFDETEPPALVFNEQALPGALVSWAWCQLKALDVLLVAIAVTGRGPGGDTEVASAVRAVIVPVINALEFSEQRASELQVGSAPQSPERRGKSRTGRKKGRAPA